MLTFIPPYDFLYKRIEIILFGERIRDSAPKGD
jgi:hypothetical protein